MNAPKNLTKEKVMEMRDYFAIQIMQALIKNTAALPEDHEFNFHSAIEFGVNFHVDIGGAGANADEKFTWAQYLAEESYEISDAMVKARSARELWDKKCEAEKEATK